MNNRKSKTESTAAKFWDRYIEFIQKQGVKESVCRWYVKRVEQYTYAHPDRKLVMHTPELIDRFLDNEGRNTKLKDGQFIQIVEAMRLYRNCSPIECGNLIAPRNSSWRLPSYFSRPYFLFLPSLLSMLPGVALAFSVRIENGHRQK